MGFRLLVRDGSRLHAGEAGAVSVPVTAISQPERLAVGGYAYLLNASGDIREAVAVPDFDGANARIDPVCGVLDTTPQSSAGGTRLTGVGEWLASEGSERAPGEFECADSRRNLRQCS